MKKQGRVDGYEPADASQAEAAAAPGKRSRSAALGPIQAKAAAKPLVASSSDHTFYPTPEPAMDHERPTESYVDSLIGSPVQRRHAGAAGGNVHELAASGLEGSSSPLPFADTIQRSFGAHDVSSIQAHVGGPAAAAAGGMGAEAYATGNSVAFASEPDLHTAAHEAAHVVQQAGGVSLKGGLGEAGDTHERHADQVADLVVQGKSAESLLTQYAPASGPATLGSGVDRVQRRELDSEELPEAESTESAPAEAEAAVEEEREAANDQVPADAFAGDVPVADPSVAETAEPSSIPPAETPAAAPTPSVPANAPSAPQNTPAAPAVPSAAGAPQRATAMSPERVKRLLHGQYMGLRKLYVAGKLTQGECAEKMVAYDRKLNGGMTSPEGTVLLLQLLAETGLAEVERHRRQQAKKPPVVAATASSSGNSGAPATATQSPSAGQSSAPVLAPVPSAAVTDERLSSLVAALRSPEAEAIAGALAGLQAKSRGLPKNRSEAQGKGRDELVAGIGALRAQMDRFNGSGLDAAKLKAFRVAVFHAIQDLSPYYFQSRNVDILETYDTTRTCNMTVLGMALEGQGRNADDYTGDREAVKAAARLYQHRLVVNDLDKVGAVDATAGQGVAWSNLIGMRLPDFLQLVAIAQATNGDLSDEGVKAAHAKAYKNVTVWSNILEMGKMFKTTAQQKLFDPTGTRETKENKRKGIKHDYKVLKQHGNKNRTPVEKFINQRNKADASGKQKDKDALEKLRPAYEAAIADPGTDSGLDERATVDVYRDHIIENVGADLDAGASVIAGLSGHFVRLQSIHDDHVLVNDPARDTRSSTKLTWEEARAMGLFAVRFVIQ
jgi:hypothetical protein